MIACRATLDVPRELVKGKLIDLWHSGKAHRHGGSIQAIFAPDATDSSALQSLRLRGWHDTDRLPGAV